MSMLADSINSADRGFRKRWLGRRVSSISCATSRNLREGVSARVDNCVRGPDGARSAGCIKILAESTAIRPSR